MGVYSFIKNNKPSISQKLSSRTPFKEAVIKRLIKPFIETYGVLRTPKTKFCRNSYRKNYIEN